MSVKLVVTGTGTGAGKTALASILLRRCIRRGFQPVVFKPLCSGGREDALALRAAAGANTSLDTINPWYFDKPLTPLLAARIAGKTISLSDITSHIRGHSAGAEVVIVECAGGLLSPFASDGDAPELIRALRAVPLVVAPNRLGVIHDVRATLHALPRSAARRALVILSGEAPGDPSCRHNAAMLAEYFDAERLFRIPTLAPAILAGGRMPKSLEAELDRILSASGVHPSA